MLTYLTQLLSRHVLEPDGTRVARVVDAIAAQGGRLPTVSALFIRGAGSEAWIPISELEIRDSDVMLLKQWSAIVPYAPQPLDLRLQRDILDKQIVDVHDYRVVRVNDVRLAPYGAGYCVVGADAGFRAMARRLGVSKPIEVLANAIGRPLHSNLIAWDDVETMEPGSAAGGRIKLKVPHEKIARLHPADIADIVEQLDPQQRAEMITALDVETAADVIQEMEDEEAAAVMETLEHERAADILDEMEPDEAADVLDDLSDARSERLLESMEPAEAADVKELLAYGDATAGGLMTTDYLAVKSGLTADETINWLRRLAPKAESIYYIYVVDSSERLTGVLSLRDLIVADPATTIWDVMSPNVRSVHTGDHADEIAHVIGRYNLLALPVVDDEQVLRGIITVDDMMERLLPPERRRKLPAVTFDKS